MRTSSFGGCVGARSISPASPVDSAAYLTRKEAPMADDPVFLYVAAYATEDDAREDYEVLKDLHATGIIHHVRRRPRHQGRGGQGARPQA